jgi:hypothetical protein
MKFTFFISTILCGIMLFSCSKDNTETISKPITTQEKPISFTIDGNLQEVDSAYALLYNNDIPPYERLMDIIGYKNGKILIEATLLEAKIGKQTLGDGGNRLITYKQGLDLNEYFASKNGTINLTLCDTIAPNIIGTFETMVQQVLGGSAIKIIKEGKIKITKLAKK